MATMVITREIVAKKIAAHLQGGFPLDDLVDWAEKALMENEFVEEDAALLSQVVGRLGVADVRTFGLTWEDCDHLVRQLGYAARVDVVPT
jgi:hypothetical protein